MCAEASNRLRLTFTEKQRQAVKKIEVEKIRYAEWDRVAS